MTLKEKFLEIMKQDRGYLAKYGDYTSELQLQNKKTIFEFNNTSPDETERRTSLLKQIFNDENLNVIIEPPFHCDYGFNIHFEGFALINYNCSILDTSPVYIGENAFIAPGVCITCAGHAHHIDDRMIYNTSRPIHIGKCVWIGANATILPGVTIGDGSVIGAGSVVNRDIPANVVAAGNPCRVIRKITEADRLNIDDDIKQI